jgi:hypothetical protein
MIFASLHHSIHHASLPVHQGHARILLTGVKLIAINQNAHWTFAMSVHDDERYSQANIIRRQP